jgi:cell division protein FtsB
LRAENAALRRRAERLRTDPATIEGVARETLGLVRPGELVVRRAR